jgi:hypothetical protein
MKFWTMNEVRFVQQNYLKMTDEEMGRELNRPKTSVEAFRMRNKIWKAKEKTQFKKGHNPWNKGKSINPGGRTCETQFKPGNRPHNIKHNYCVSVRNDSRGVAYKHIRIQCAKWVPLHRFIWETTHGEIPKGSIVIFKDKNPMNCTLDNLECITRGESVTRNANRKKAAKKMIKHWMVCRTKEAYGIKTTRHTQLKRLFNN